MVRPSVADTVFAFLHPRRHDENRSVMQVVRADDFSLAPFSIAIGMGGTTEYGMKEIDTGVAALRRAADDHKTLVGFDVSVLVAALELRHGIVFEQVVDAQNYLRFLALSDDFDNARALAGAGAVNPIDVVRMLFRQMFEDRRFPLIEQFLAQRILQENVRGIRVDRDAANELLRKMTAERDDLLASFCRTFPDFDTSWLGTAEQAERYAVKLTVKRETEFRALRHMYLSLSSTIRDVVKIAGGTERVFFALKYFGARTGRLSGSGQDAGKLNIHSLPARGGDDRSELLAEVRGLLVADDDESWISCDLSIIEPRILALLARDDGMLGLFTSGQDPYITFARGVFPETTIGKGGENGHLRQLGKEGVIALGYGMRLPGFTLRVLEKFPDTDPALIEKVYDGFNRQFPRIQVFRERLWQTFCEVFEKGGEKEIGGCRISAAAENADAAPDIAVKLPTWRALTYRSVVKLPTYKRNWLTTIYKYAPEYRLGSDRQHRDEIHSGTLINNVCQAIARDILVHHQVEIERNGALRVRFSVHDELLVSSPRCRCPRRDDDRVPLGQRHAPDCPWMAGRDAVKNLMSTVNPGLKQLRTLPIACELSPTIRDRWGK